MDLQTLWKEVSREARTSIGRRRSFVTGGGTQPPPKIERPPPGATGLVLQEDEDSGWDLVEQRKPAAQPVVHEREEPIVSLAATYIVGGEVDAPYEEDPEYRQAWDLPSRPAKPAVAPSAANGSAGHAVHGSRRHGPSAAGLALAPDAWSPPADDDATVHVYDDDERLPPPPPAFLLPAPPAAPPAPQAGRPSDMASSSPAVIVSSRAGSAAGKAPMVPAAADTDTPPDMLAAAPGTDGGASSAADEARGAAAREASPPSDAAAAAAAGGEAARDEFGMMLDDGLAGLAALAAGGGRGGPGAGAAFACAPPPPALTEQDVLQSSSARADTTTTRGPPATAVPPIVPPREAQQHPVRPATSPMADRRASAASSAVPNGGGGPRQAQAALLAAGTLNGSAIAADALGVAAAQAAASALGLGSGLNGAGAGAAHGGSSADAGRRTGGLVGKLRLLWSLGQALVWLVVGSARALLYALSGLIHAHHPMLSLHHLLREPHARKCFMQCLFLNAGIFRGLLYVYESLVPPLCESLFGVQLAGDWRYDLTIVLGWAAPCYLLCEIVSTKLLFAMAKQLGESPEEAAAVAGGRSVSSSTSSTSGMADTVARRVASSRATPSSPTDPMVTVMSIVYTRIIYLIFIFQIKLLCGVPLIGPLLTLVLSALLHAYDSFEFVWEHRGCGVAERFALIEHHWHYFLGYGGILASLSLRLRFWDLFAIRAVLYPLYIANAYHAKFEGRKAEKPLPVFWLPLLLFNSIVKLATLGTHQVQSR